jgi:hypothetical protein
MRILLTGLSAMTIGAGVQWRDAFLAAQSNGRVLAGGVCDTIGASGGWVLGGGHSILSGKYGLGKCRPLFYISLASSTIIL